MSARPAAWLALAAALALGAGCGSGGSGQSGSAFAFLTVDGFSLSGTTAVATVTSSIDDVGSTTLVCVTLRNNAKNPTVTVPTSLDNVILQSYTVDLRRVDGVPIGGVQTFGASVLIPAGSLAQGLATGNTATFPIVVVPAASKQDPEVRPPNRLPISATATILFRGRDGRGQRVETQGAVTVVFVTGGSDSTATCAAATPAPTPTPTT